MMVVVVVVMASMMAMTDIQVREVGCGVMVSVR